MGAQGQATIVVIEKQNRNQKS
jgi:hypothetical protein